uniref:SFRICE_023171 n=1 Tax=Spodoptera frugiperda TaxID=7108 RepID=A0A2H1W7J7_SPOFR
MGGSDCLPSETPKELKRRQPLLELPKDFSKKPKLFEEKKSNDSDIKISGKSDSASEIQDGGCGKAVKSHCCCKCDSESCHQAVKVIIAPAMMPSIFGPVPGIPYIVQPGKVEKQSCWSTPVVLNRCRWSVDHYLFNLWRHSDK